MDQRFVVLVVCRANVCRSPLAESLMAEALDQAGMSGTVVVESAGTHAAVGEPACPQAVQWSPQAGAGRGSRPVTPQLLGAADLVLAADRESRAECAHVDPGSRSRMFTLRQAALLTDHLVEQVESGGAPDGSPSLPSDAVPRLRWMVGEMDAARALLSGRAGLDEDIRDEHGLNPHPRVFEQISDAAASVSRALVVFA